MIEKYRIYKDNIIKALEALSNQKYQEIAWFDNDQGLSFSFLEIILTLFDDSTLSDALNDGEIIFGKNADDNLRNLEEQINKIDENISAETLINFPQMEIVRQQARKTLNLIKKGNTSESTVEIVD